MAGPCLILAGPTASGKSALAVALARALGGEIVNADSMQVYRDLSILTACPSDEEMAGVPHHLYGLLAGGEACTVGRWLSWMHRLLPLIWGRGRWPLVVGGTGLYLRALTAGLAPVPEVPAAVRAAVPADYDRLGGAAFAAELMALDPVAAVAVPSGNRQRMIRAMEVARHTGRALSDWQAAPHLGGLIRPPTTMLVEPDRDWLYGRCDRRFLAMLAAGAQNQVRAALAAGLTPDSPVCRGLGARALIAAAAGEIDQETAVLAAQRKTRNYAKRQLTWFRHQLLADIVVRPPGDDLESPGVLSELTAEVASRLGL